MNISNGLLIDWITLRYPVDQLPPLLQEKLFSNMNVVCSFKTDGQGNPIELDWETRRLNFDALRSDSDGLFVTCTFVKDTAWLYVGASPASLLNDCNVFGSLDVVAGAEALVSRARRALSSFLAPVTEWELKRLDVTGNYCLPDHAHVKTALRQLIGTDSARRKSTSSKNGGDTVLWSPTSDVFAGKAYHKGPHLRSLVRLGKLQLDESILLLADRLLRLELRIGSRFFRHLVERRTHRYFVRHWSSFSEADLTDIYREYFCPLVSGVEVRDMGRVQQIEMISASNGISHSRARSAYKTLDDIREYGLDEVKASMPERTFYRHRKYLKAAGFTDSDLSSFLPGNVVQFRPIRIEIARPVSSWEEIRRAA